MPYKPNDHYARKAKKENFVARSVYKLDEIDKKFRVVKEGDYVLDLGASPGSWSQFVSGRIGPKGKLLGVDLKPVTVKLSNGIFIQADINDLDVKELMEKYGIEKKFDAVISDMAPNTSGNKFVDQARSYDLCMMAYENAKKFLCDGGTFICKIFDGEDAMTLRDELKRNFSEVHILRPKSVQSSSKEMFFIAKFFGPGKS